MGTPPNTAKEIKVNSFCKILSEFALEYRTTREKVLTQLQKKQNNRERKKTRGKMIIEVRGTKKGNLGANAMERVAAGADLP